MTYNLSELDDIMKKEVATKEGSSKPKVSLNFELTRSHLFKLKSASVSIDEKVVEEIIPEKKEEKEEDGEEKDTEDSEEADSEGSGEEEKVEEIENSEESTEESDGDEVEKEYREYIEPHTFTLEINEVLHGARLLNKD